MTSEDTSVWNSFIQSLDVDPDKAKNIEQLPESQKRQLIESYVISFSYYFHLLFRQSKHLSTPLFTM